MAGNVSVGVESGLIVDDDDFVRMLFDDSDIEEL